MILTILTHALAFILGAAAMLVLLVAIADDGSAWREYQENTDRRLRR